MARIVIFTRLTALPGRRDELLAALDELGRASLDEPGTEVFVSHAARDEPDVVLGYEVFRDADALAAHRASNAMDTITAALGELLAGPPEIVYAS